MNKILIIDNDCTLLNSLEVFLAKRSSFDIITTSEGNKAVELLHSKNFDIILTDLVMPDFSGLNIIETARRNNNGAQVIVMTSSNDVSHTILAMQKGAYDYINKPLDFEQLFLKIKKALEVKTLGVDSQNLVVDNPDKFAVTKQMVGNTTMMREIFKYIGQLSLNKTTVLITGESGTGKELIARMIHSAGSKSLPFVAVNCSAISETLLETELFGHVKGSFTGAFRDKKGKFELAGNGTIFLDDISEMPLNLQSKLLRVIQEKEFERVGGEESVPMNARIITATNKNLQTLVAQGKFREDLYYRLKVFTIRVPSLSERIEDIPLLVNHFLQKLNFELGKNIRKIPYSVLELLENHKWTGNVRELENVLRQAAVLCKTEVLEKDNIILQDVFKSKSNGFPNPTMSLTDVEKYHIQKVLEYTQWNIKRACEILKVSKPTIYSKIKQYDIKKLVN